MPSVYEIQGESPIGMNKKGVKEGISEYNLIFRTMAARRAAAEFLGIADFVDVTSSGFTEMGADLVVAAVTAKLSKDEKEYANLVDLKRSIVLRVRS